MNYNCASVTQMAETLSRPGFTTREERHVIWLRSDIQVAMAGEANRDDEFSEVVLTNLSRGGFGAVDGQFVAGMTVMVDIPVVGWREADVRWLTDSRAGCRFVQPLTHDQLRAAVSASPKLSEYFPGVAEVLAA